MASANNQDIAANIIGHIRRAALGDHYYRFEQRVANAMMKIYAAQLDSTTAQMASV